MLILQFSCVHGTCTSMHMGRGTTFATLRGGGGVKGETSNASFVEIAKAVVRLGGGASFL